MNTEEKPWYEVTIPLDRIPSNRRGRELVIPNYKPLVKFITEQLPSDSEIAHALLHPKNYAFRGLRRPLSRPDLLKQVRQTITQHGLDRGGPNGERTWFEKGSYITPFILSLSTDWPIDFRNYLIVSRREGMKQKYRSWINGTGLKPGYTFKDLHVGTVEMQVVRAN